MTRLIDADELLKELDEWEADLYDTSSDRQLGVTDAIVIACQMPTVDAVPIEFIRSEIKKSKGFYNSSLRRLLDAWAERKEE